MTLKEAFEKVLKISGFALFFALAVFLSFELYSIYLQSLSAIPVLILLLAVFGALSYFKYNKKLKARYFIIAYLVFICLPTLILMILNSPLFILFLIVFILTFLIFIFLIDKDEEEFMKKQRLFVKIGIDLAEGIFALVISFIFGTSIFLVFNVIIPEQTSFLPNIKATIYYSSSSLYNYKPLNTPDIFVLFNYFNPTNQTKIKGIVNIERADNITYENTTIGYCLNANTNKYWLQNCITYSPYSASFISNKNYMLTTEVWKNGSMIFGASEIIPNASIYKNQTFYLKLVVKNNTYVVYETNNGKIESIKVVLPKGDDFGIIENGSSISTETHERVFYALNTGFLGFYSTNSILQSLAGNFTNVQFEVFGWNAYYNSSYMPHTNFAEAYSISNNILVNKYFAKSMNSTQLKDLKSLEDGKCYIYYEDIKSFGSFKTITEVPIAIENKTNTSLNTTLCNTNETLLQYLTNKVLPMFSGWDFAKQNYVLSDKLIFNKLLNQRRQLIMLNKTAFL